MQQSTRTLPTPDGITLHTIAWLPEDTPRALVFIVHGIGEHSGRYQHVAEHLVGHGFAVYSHDHRGHGQSSGERVMFNNFETPVNDLKHYFDDVRANYSADLPVFLYGHSMGSLISLLFTLQYQTMLTGLISTGTPINIDETVPSLAVNIGQTLSRFMPRLPFAGLDVNTLSHDPAVVKAYVDDPLVHNERLKLGMVANMIAYGRAVRERLSQLTLPLLILHGSDDEITPNSGSELIHARATSTDKTLKIYPGLLHEIHNEPEQAQVLSDISTWLDAHIAPD